MDKKKFKISNIGRYLYPVACLVFVLALTNGALSNDFYSNIFFIGSMIISSIATLALVIDSEQVDHNIFLQLSVFWIIAAAIWILSFINTDSSIIIKQTAVNGIIYTILNSVLSLIGFFATKPQMRVKVIDYFKRNGIALFVVVLFVVLNHDIFNVWNWTDSLTYAKSISGGAGTWNFTLNYLQTFRLGGHISYGYTILLYIGHYLWPNGYVGIHIVNLVMSGITILAFNSILNKLFTKLGIVEKGLIVFAFAFSPLFFGLSYTINIDFALFCFFVWMVWANIYNYKIFQYLSIILVCFSKEFGVALVFAYFIGLYIFKYLIFREDRITLKGLHSELYNLIGPILWAVELFLLNDGWAAVLNGKTRGYSDIKGGTVNKYFNSFHFDLDYIAVKFKELFVMNFAWVTVLIIILVFILILLMKLIKKKRLDKFISSYEVALLISAIAFISINCIFFTYTHYRYLQLNIFFMMLLVAFAMERLRLANALKCIFLVVIAASYIVSCYVTVDPLTLSNFTNINTGNGTIVSTKSISCAKVCRINPNAKDVRNNVMLDGTAYNRQMIGLQQLIEKTLKDINYDGSQLVIVEPVYADSATFTLFNIIGANGISNFHWNKDTKHLTTFEKDIPINFYDSKIPLDKSLNEYKAIYFLDLPFGHEIDKTVYLKDYNIEKVTTVKVKNWSLNLNKLQVKNAN